ncbi:hypothetical protein HAP48_0042680 [Bradyrhizobium septentrionale]|uniref:Uncharacterized protein n=1 Tax=Bradyrhizobium septentrionale TaxID=1404411 RepID=A0A973W3B3_9BRAD|nr:hypothetical protein [Bradyrhizobium septentrionale]UGY15164.1 hypothetical protein HAP48_0042680 [Bradyrhizobium septentrionale]
MFKRAFDHVAAQAAALAMSGTGSRRYIRWITRGQRTAAYYKNGLNGPRAVARRLRQIEAGSLTEANGLVRA